jgi:hypothetical protein
VITNYEKIVDGMKNRSAALGNNAKFVSELEKIADSLVEGK